MFTACASAILPAELGGLWLALRDAIFRWLLGVGAIAGPLAPAAAHAEFTVCNQTLDVVNLAVAHDVGDAAMQDGVWTMQTEGWWTIGANQCVNVIQNELENRYVYVYATDVFGQPILTGTDEMCVEPKRFVIHGIRDCWQRGYMVAKFSEVDTKEQERWTLFLTSSLNQ